MDFDCVGVDTLGLMVGDGDGVGVCDGLGVCDGGEVGTNVED